MRLTLYQQNIKNSIKKLFSIKGKTPDISHIKELYLNYGDDIHEKF